MFARARIVVACAAFAALLLNAAGAGQKPADPSPSAHEAVLNTYCVTCHSDKARTGGLSLERANLTAAPQEAELWEKVIRKVRAGMMPPPGMPRPGGAALDSVAAFLEGALDRAQSS